MDFGVEELAGFWHAWTIDICLVIPILCEAETGEPRVRDQPGPYIKGVTQKTKRIFWLLVF